MNRAFSAGNHVRAMNPGRMPWAGMNDAFSVSKAYPGLHRACLEEIGPAPRSAPHLISRSPFEAGLATLPTVVRPG